MAISRREWLNYEKYRFGGYKEIWTGVSGNGLPICYDCLLIATLPIDVIQEGLHYIYEKCEKHSCSKIFSGKSFSHPLHIKDVPIKQQKDGDHNE